MTFIALSSSLDIESAKDGSQHGVVTDEIEGLIKVYKDGHVERPPIVPCVSPSLANDFGVTSQDIVIDQLTNIWARFYAPNIVSQDKNINIKCYKLPLIVYFHGGGFCVGSAAWSCYHEFLAKLASKANCLIMSVNYRLAPENPLPAAYEDGVKCLTWLKTQQRQRVTWWSGYCNFSSMFLAGDSAGANIAYNIIARLVPKNSCQELSKNLVNIKGVVLIQPFLGGETRTKSEKYLVQSARSALSLAASDTYWRLALPREANRDHPFCNPLVKMEELEVLNQNTLVFISEMDILRDRNLEFACALDRVGKKVEHVVFEGVGHAFQVLGKSQISQARTIQMIEKIKDFVRG